MIQCCPARLSKRGVSRGQAQVESCVKERYLNEKSLLGKFSLWAKSGIDVANHGPSHIKQYSRLAFALAVGIAQCNCGTPPPATMRGLQSSWLPRRREIRVGKFSILWGKSEGHLACEMALILEVLRSVTIYTPALTWVSSCLACAFFSLLSTNCFAARMT